MIICSLYLFIPDHAGIILISDNKLYELREPFNIDLYKRYEPDEIIILEDIPKYSHICINVLKSSYMCDRAIISRNRLNTFILSYSQRGCD